MRAWCVRLLAGTSVELPVEWLGGTPGWAPYWSRVWGARGLLHLGPGDHASAVLAAVGDEHWRVREMALKVIARHEVDDPGGRVDAAVDDPIERVRVQAWRVLGREAPP